MYVHNVHNKGMKFEWDAAKNQSNISKHGISFDTAKRVFDGVVLTAIDDRFDYGEVREISIGLIEKALYLVVVHTKRNDTTTRIISARKANQAERYRYDQALR